MSIKILKAVLLASFLFCLPNAYAFPGAGRGPTVDEKIERMTRKLELSDEQQNQLKAVFEEFKAAREKKKDSIEGILTEEQLLKFKERHRRGGKGRRGRHGRHHGKGHGCSCGCHCDAEPTDTPPPGGEPPLEEDVE